MTEWRPVVGWERHYECSSCGRVRSINRTITKADGTSQVVRQKDLTLMLSTTGYSIVRLSDVTSGRRATAKVHRIVAQAFIENATQLPEVNHRNGVKTDNRIDNLEWTTSRGNRKHAWDTGLRTRKHLPIKFGEQNPQSKLSAQIVVQARALHASGASAYSLAKLFGVSKKTMREALSGKTWNMVPAPPAAGGDAVMEAQPKEAPNAED